MTQLRGAHAGAGIERAAHFYRIAWGSGAEADTLMSGYLVKLAERQARLPTTGTFMANAFVSLSAMSPSRAQAIPVTGTDETGLDWVSDPVRVAARLKAEGLRPSQIEWSLDQRAAAKEPADPSTTSWFDHLLRHFFTEEQTDLLHLLIGLAPMDVTLRAPQIDWYRNNDSAVAGHPAEKRERFVEAVLDLHVPTIADRTEDYDYVVESSAPSVQRCTRRLRIITVPGTSLLVWHERQFDTSEPLDAWNPEDQRGRFQGFAPVRSLGRPADVAEHVSICLRHASTASLAWSRRLSVQLARGQGMFDQVKVDELQAELGSIGSAIALADISVRNSLLRLSEEPRAADLKAWQSHFDNLAVQVQEDQEQYSKNLNRLSSLALGVQSHLRESQGRGFALITALVLLPSLVIGVFGANLAALSSGAKASPADLVVWIIASSVITLSLLMPAWRSRLVVVPVIMLIASFIALAREQDVWVSLTYAAIAILAVQGVASLWARRRGAG
jgi:hypothetical protein